MEPQTEKKLTALEENLPQFIQDAAHPTVCFFHLLFKLLALFFYMFFGLFDNDKTLCYILVITMCAFDFWTVKNVTGR